MVREKRPDPVMKDNKPQGHNTYFLIAITPSDNKNNSSFIAIVRSSSTLVKMISVALFKHPWEAVK
jgi:hypothetical protein